MEPRGRRIAVIGAAGLTGQFLVAGLQRRGFDIVAVVRDARKTDRFAGGTGSAVADLSDVHALTNAVEGCDAAYLIPPSFNPGEETFAVNLMKALSQAGVRRFVYHSVLHSPTPAMPHHDRKSRVELLVRESELEWTILQPAMYVQTVLSFLSDDRSILRPPFDAGRPFNLMAPDDLVDAVARVLSDPATAYGTFELAGRERLSMHDMADELASVLGRPVDVAMADLETQVASRAAKRGWSASQQGEYRAMLDYYGRHGLPGSGLTLEMLIRRPSTAFGDAAGALLRV